MFTCLLLGGINKFDPKTNKSCDLSDVTFSVNYLSYLGQASDISSKLSRNCFLLANICINNYDDIICIAGFSITTGNVLASNKNAFNIITGAPLSDNVGEVYFIIFD